LASTWARADAAFPVRVTRSFWERMRADDPNDPLALQALPHPSELLADPDDLVDPVGDAARSPLPWIVRKHPDRVLFLTTKRCHLHCRYCFRRDHHPSDALDPSAAEWEAALRYIEASGAQELILSGGDPLMLRDERLFEVIDRCRASIPVLRVHTRAPITAPWRVTSELVAGLAARGPVWVLVHVNHPRELSPEVDQALARFVNAGLPVLNQAVLLKGVNDDVEALVALSRALVRRRVFPYYLHHPDKAAGNAHLRVSVERGLELHRALGERVSGVALPRYVWDQPDGSGKVDLLKTVDLE